MPRVAAVSEADCYLYYDHLPPHVHFRRKGEYDVAVEIATGQVIKRRGSPPAKREGAWVAWVMANRDCLSELWGYAERRVEIPKMEEVCT